MTWPLWYIKLTHPGMIPGSSRKSSGIPSWEADVPFENIRCSCWGLLKLIFFINQKQVESWNRLTYCNVYKVFPLPCIHILRRTLEMLLYVQTNLHYWDVNGNDWIIRLPETICYIPAIWHMFNAFPPLLTAASWQLRLSWQPVASPFPW